MSNKFSLALCVAAWLLALNACGKKGDLVLPQSHPAPATAPSPAP